MRGRSPRRSCDRSAGLAQDSRKLGERVGGNIRRKRSNHMLVRMIVSLADLARWII
jgi:hypothetical protein